MAEPLEEGTRKRTRGKARPKALDPEPVEAGSPAQDASPSPTPPPAPPAPPMALQVGASQHSDVATARDLLGFGAYVSALAQFLMHPDSKPPITVSVEAPWGAGKTSFLKQLQAALKARTADGAGEPAVAVWFNPWRIKSDEAMWASLALSVERELNKVKKPSAARYVKRIAARPVSGAVQPLAYGGAVVGLLVANKLGLVDATLAGLAGIENAIAQATVLAAALGGGVLGVRKAARDFKQEIVKPLETSVERSRSAPDYASKLEFAQLFHDDFARMLGEHKDKGRVVVLVDDLDRCEPARVAELMQAINLMIPDNDRVVFVLALDREKVAAAIAAKHESMLHLLLESAAMDDGKIDRDEALDFGYQFLEKFIQVPFVLPVPGEPQVAAYINELGGSSGEKPPAKERRVVAALGAQGNIAIASSLAPAGAQVKRSKLRAELGADSPTLKALARRAAPALENNPRRVKQYINLLRLQAFMANEVGLLQDERSHVPKGGVTLAQLGTFVAVSTGWPRLVAEARRDPTLLLEVEALATAQYRRFDATLPSEPASKRAEYWASRAGLARVLGEPVPDEKDADRERVLLAGADIDGLLRTLPAADDPHAKRRGIKATPAGPAFYARIADGLVNAGDFGEAARNYEMAIELVRAEGKPSSESGSYFAGLATALRLAGRTQEALSAAKAAMDFARTLDPPQRLRVQAAYAETLVAANQLEEGLDVARGVLGEGKRLLDEGDPQALASTLAASEVLLDHGDVDSALASVQKVLRVVLERGGDDLTVGTTFAVAARTFAAAGEMDAARQNAASAIERLTGVLGPSHRVIQQMRTILGEGQTAA